MARMPYFSSNIHLAERVIEYLDLGGRPLLAQVAESDPALYSQWDDMSRVGFLANAPEVKASRIPPLIYEFRNGVSSAQLADIEHLDWMLGSTLPVQFNTWSLDPLNELLAMINNDQGATERRKRVTVYTGVESEPANGLATLVEMLDSGLITLRRDLDILSVCLNRDERTEFQKLLEHEGFLLPYRIIVRDSEVLDPSSAFSVVQALGGILSRAPSRELEVTFERPDASSPSDIANFYGRLQELLRSIFLLEMDASRVAPFGVYLAAALHHDDAASPPVRVRSSEGGITFSDPSFPFIEHVLQKSSPLFSRFDPECLLLPIARGRTLAASELLPRSPALENFLETGPASCSHLESFASHEQQLGCEIIGWMLEELLDLCESSMEGALPLEVRIKAKGGLVS